MAKAIKLNAKDTENALSWMHDMLYAGGIKSTTRRSSWYTFTNNVYNQQRTEAEQDCKEICTEILNRQFKDLDNCFNRLAECEFRGTFTHKAKRIKRSAEYLASYVAWFCAQNEIYWDNRLKSSYEMEIFEATLLGAALKLYDCFVEPVVAQKVAQTNKSTGGTGRVAGQPPKNDYKSSGGQSSNVRDLKGTPGNKEILSVSVLYRIEGTNANTTKVPSAFIKPLKANGAVGSTNKVFIGDPSGYTDCTLFFDDSLSADTFLAQCMQRASIPNNISNLHVAKVKVDKNGYYRVGTEYGDAYIKASKLNEAIAEQANSTLAENNLKALKEQGADYIDDVAEFTKNLMKE